MSGAVLHKGLILTGYLLAVFVVEASALLMTSGSDSRRRSRFWLRFLSAGLTMPGLLLTLVLADQLGLVSSQLAAGLSSLRDCRRLRLPGVMCHCLTLRSDAGG